jgi:hypothetical protein
MPIARHRTETNGIAERCVRTLKEWLLQYAWESDHELEALLRQSRATYNDRTHKALGFQAYHRMSSHGGFGSSDLLDVCKRFLPSTTLSVIVVTTPIPDGALLALLPMPYARLHISRSCYNASVISE